MPTDYDTILFTTSTLIFHRLTLMATFISAIVFNDIVGVHTSLDIFLK